MNKKYQVFVSSTYKDLNEKRPFNGGMYRIAGIYAYEGIGRNF